MGRRVRLIAAGAVVVTLAIAIAYVRFSAPPPSAAAPVADSPAPSASEPPASAASADSPSSSPTITPSAVSASPAPAAASPSLGAAAPTPAPSATAVPAATANPNLLSYVNGAIVRRWTVGGGDGGNAPAMEHLYVIDPQFAKPLSFDFEMPSVSHVTRIGTTVFTTAPATIRIATGRSIDAERDAGTIRLANDDGKTEHSIEVNVDARYVRVTVTRAPGTDVRILGIAAYGVPGRPERGSLAGTWVAVDNVDASGDAMFESVKGSIPEAPPANFKANGNRSLVAGGTYTLFSCDRQVPAWHGSIAGGVVSSPDGGRLQLAGDGKLLVGRVPGMNGSGTVILVRDPRRGGTCDESESGNGPNVLALARDGSREEPEIEPSFIPGYRFHRAMPMLLNKTMLAHAQFAMLIDDCTATNDLVPSQKQLLLNWVAAGHKLIIRDSDACTASDYGFIPYKFSTAATGARGARGSVLSVADASTLGSGPGDRAHFLDTAAYVHAPSQDIGDADIMETDDEHWCGHLFARNVAGASGWAHAYARFGRGLIIYNGLDRDDIGYRDSPALAVVRYEYAQPVRGSLPCNAKVASALALYPGADRRLPAASPATLRVPLSLTYVTRSGSDQHVRLAIAGDARYAASVAPATTKIRSGQTLPVVATISLPKGWSGVHAFTVSATGAYNALAQAPITIDGSVALARAFQQQRRVRIYGIHFDVDSATILPQSESTVAQIAQVLRVNPAWRMRVEGYTDSDGGAAYNLDLSDRRAHSVVSDLVAHYKIAPSRLTAAGFGLTHPVASNSTAGGKALNRRVELVRL